MARAALAAALLVLGCASLGCAPTSPLLVGGSTTPNARTDLAAGAAVRVPLVGLRRDQATAAEAPLLALASSGGAAPVAIVRRGLARDLDVGLGLAGALGQVSLRYDVHLDGDVGRLHLVLGGLVQGGYAAGSEDAEAGRVGVELPAVLGVSVGGLYEAWLGARVGVDYASGRAAGMSLDAFGFHAGGLVGLGAGFRWVHVLLELAVDYARWSGGNVARDGVVLTPSFALRLRF